MKRYVKSNKRDDFIAKSMKQRNIRKFIHDSVKDDPALKDAKQQDRALANKLKSEGKEYHPDSQEWY